MRLLSGSVLTLANQLTLLRLVAIPFFVLAVLEERHELALVLLGLAAASDALDGWLARGLNQRTALGGYLDPVADKLLLCSAIVVLTVRGQLPWTFTVLVLGRDVLILAIAGVIILVAGYRSFRPTRLGKASTAAQLATVAAAMTALVWPLDWLVQAKQALLALAAALVIVSGIQYAVRTGRLLARLPSQTASGEAATGQQVESGRETEERPLGRA